MEKRREVFSEPLDKSGEEQLAYLGLGAEQLEGTVLELGSGETEKLKDTAGLPDSCKIVSLSREIFRAGTFIRALKERPEWDKRTTEADALALPFRNETFNRIISVDAIPQLLTSEKAIRTAFGEIWRILKPGGEARLFPVGDNMFHKAREVLADLGARITIEPVGRAILDKYGYFDPTVQRLIIEKPREVTRISD